MRRKWGRLAVVLAVIGAVGAPPPAPARPVVTTAFITSMAVPSTAVPSTAAVSTVAAPTSAAVVPVPPARVDTDGVPLNMRTGPSTAHRIVGRLADGSRVRVLCQVYGQTVGRAGNRSPYWDRLAKGRYVADAYLIWRPTRPAVRWCGAAGEPTTSVVATAGGPVNLRSGPGTRYRLMGRLPNGTPLVVRCQRWGERISGPRATTAAWNLLASGRYVSDALVVWRSPPSLPWCDQAAPTVPASTEEAFIARVARPAQLGMRRYRVPASVTIAQAILESGWGRSELARRDHNYFGIKCFGDPGPLAVGCRSYATSECGGDGECWRTAAQFRAYRDVAGSMADHGRFLVVNPRYRMAFRYIRDANRFAIAIHRAGYATSPTYATNLIQIMRRYNLYRYDR